jgi:hypothetical protein
MKLIVTLIATIGFALASLYADAQALQSKSLKQTQFVPDSATRTERTD